MRRMLTRFKNLHPTVGFLLCLLFQFGILKAIDLYMTVVGEYLDNNSLNYGIEIVLKIFPFIFLVFGLVVTFWGLWYFYRKLGANGSRCTRSGTTEESEPEK